MQLLRVFFALVRSILAGLRSVVISYGKFLDATRGTRPARKAPLKTSSMRRSKNVVVRKPRK